MRFPLPGGGQAIFGSSGLNNYRHPNWQGSQTLASSPTRTMLVDNAFTPFGDKYAEYNGGYNGFFADMLAIGPNGLIADGYQSETRMLHGSQGRWVSPDPAGLGAVDPTNPQSWNRYAYVGNDPLNHVDPSGMLQPGDPGYNPPAPCSGGTEWNGYQCVYPTTNNFGWCGILDVPGPLCSALNQSSYAGLFSGEGASGPSNGEPPSTCLAANIAAVNQVSNLNVNMSNVVGQPFIYNGGLDVNFSVPGGSPSQLPVGRYSSTILGRIFGFGSSLHVPGPGGADPSTYGVDANGNFTFTTHIDSAYATWHTPIGAIIHYFTDVRGQGAHRKPC